MSEQFSLTVATPEAQGGRSSTLDVSLVRSTFFASPAEPIALRRRATSAQALAVIVGSCLRQIVQNEGGVLHGCGEAVHQMCVGLRRLRAALSVFGSALQEEQSCALKNEIAWFIERLTALRDYDTLLTSNRHFEELTLAGCEGASELAEALARRREEALACARAAVTSARLHQFILSSTVDLVLHSDTQLAGERLASKLARQVLERRSKRVRRRLEQFVHLSVVERHELRIQVKKLRYETDFFATVFLNANRYRRFSCILNTLQKTLRGLDDGAVQRRIVSDIVERGAGEGRVSRRIAFALGALNVKQEAEARMLAARVPDLAARFAKTRPFWR